jgi:L-Ala-D/L-Glu epimerase
VDPISLLMALELSVARFRLLFKQPFGTSHGVRDGTDAIFIRAREGDQVGYGEVTLPPYLKERPESVVERLSSIASTPGVSADQLLQQLDQLPELKQGANGCRAGLHMALIDLIGRKLQAPVQELLGVVQLTHPITLVTIGISTIEELAAKLNDLPVSGALKIKVNDTAGAALIDRIKELDSRKLFLDGNQGIEHLEQAMILAKAAGDRLLGFEEPFAPELRHLNQELGERSGVTVYADESVQEPKDVAPAHGVYGGVNIKLMKCGGLDRAMASAMLARENGLNVMLGSMSESSLGCTAMAQLSVGADLVDLDGPWLLKNDPFQGISMVNGELVLPDGPGLGVSLRAQLPFDPICA